MGNDIARDGYFRITVSLILTTVAAYAFSFALDLLIGGLIGAYPSTAYLPVFAWSAISVVALFISLKLVRDRRWMPFPFVAFGCLAAFAGLFGTSRRSLVVAGLMFLQAYLLWRIFRQACNS